jgi:hypothetical protein
MDVETFQNLLNLVKHGLTKQSTRMRAPGARAVTAQNCRKIMTACQLNESSVVACWTRALVVTGSNNDRAGFTVVGAPGKSKCGDPYQ